MRRPSTRREESCPLLFRIHLDGDRALGDLSPDVLIRMQTEDGCIAAPVARRPPCRTTPQPSGAGRIPQTRWSLCTSKRLYHAYGVIPRMSSLSNYYPRDGVSALTSRNTFSSEELTNSERISFRPVQCAARVCNCLRASAKP